MTKELKDVCVDINKQEYFVCDLFDAFKDDMASMEHPFLSLSTRPDHRHLKYENNGNWIKIKPSSTGLATIHDKDILMYVMSSLMSAKNKGLPLSNRVQFKAYDYLKSTKKDISGDSYDKLMDSLRRLKGTSIETNIQTGGFIYEKEFGLIDDWEVVSKEKDNGKKVMIYLEIRLSDWIFNSIINPKGVLTVTDEYFKIRKPTNRRLYEIVKKHLGVDKNHWKISLQKLQLKMGSNATIDKFRYNIRQSAKDNLPEFEFKFEKDKEKTDKDTDILIFTRREPIKKKKYVTQKDIEANMKAGETADQAKARLIAEAKSQDNKAAKKTKIAEPWERQGFASMKEYDEHMYAKQMASYSK